MADKIGTNLPDSAVLYYADPGREPDAELLAAFDHGEGAPKNSSDGGHRYKKYRPSCIREGLLPKARKLARELRTWPLRISAALSIPNWCAYLIPDAPKGVPRGKFGLACNEDIQQLLEDHPWASHLDGEIAAKAYALGAAWAFGILNSSNKSDIPKA